MPFVSKNGAGMSTSQVLYVLLCSFAAALCLWAFCSAAPAIGEHGRWHRAWTLASGCLLPIVTPAVVAGHLLDLAPAHALLFLMPPLVIACMWSNATTLKAQGLGVRLLHLPVQTWNGLLCGLYTITVARDLLGVDVGDAAATLGAAFVDLQVWIGDPSAERDPCWLYLPFALPLWLAYRWHHVLVLALASLCSTALVVLFASALPDASLRTHSFRGEFAAETGEASHGSRVVCGAVEPWTERLLGTARATAFLAHRRDLHAEVVATVATTDLFADDALVQQTREQFRRAREEGHATWVLTTPARRFEHMPARDLDELAADVSKAQWLAAEQLQPDWLLLYVGPFGRLATQMVVPATVDDWLARIQRSAAEARQANPRVRLAVALEHRAPHTKELFERLHAQSSSVDGIAFVVAPGRGTRDEAQQILRTQKAWCVRSTGSKPLWFLVEVGSPASLGGELGQKRWLESVLADCLGFPHLEGVLLDALVDHGSGAGLWTREGRARPAVPAVRRLLTSPEPATPR